MGPLIMEIKDTDAVLITAPSNGEPSPVVQNTAYNPSEVSIFAFKGIKGTLDKDDNRTDKAVAFKVLKQILEIGHPDLTPEAVANSLSYRGYEIRTMDDIHLLKEMEETDGGAIKVYQNGTVIGYGTVPVRNMRKVLAPPSTDGSMAIQKTREVIIIEDEDTPKQAIEAVVMMEETTVSPTLPNSDYSYILNQPNPDIKK